VKRFGTEDGFVEEKVKSIFCDTNGVYWFGTEGKGLWRFEGGQFFALSTQDGLSGNWIKDMLRDASGNLWIATAGGGLSIIRSDQISKLKEKDGLLRDRVNCLYRDEMKRIWYGTEGGGLGMIDAERMKSFTIAEGMSSNLVRGIREDQNGYLWVATGGGGLSRIDIYRGMKVMRFTRDNGLTSDNLYLIEIDDQNNLWVGSESGVDRVILNENSEVKEIKHFGKQEGFQGIETCQNAVTKTSDGSIWFGTINGLTRFTPDHAEKNTIGPKLRLTGVNLFYQPLSETRFAAHVAAWGGYLDGLKLNYDENHIGFEFIGIDLKNPASVKYQWKLDGVDEEWSPWSLKRDVTYSNLAPGSYTFMVNAMNEDGVKSEKTLEFQFLIYPPFWQTWWFNVLVYGSVVLLIAALVLFFTRRSRRRHRELRERFKLEKRMLELEQKALRLQMNPHFIFHALNSIQGMIGQKDEKTARLYLSKFSKLMRSILENSREQLIPLEKEVQTLDDYLSLEKFTRNDAFDYSIQVDDSIDPEEVMIPSMLLQPFVENSIIHGFNGLNRRGNIEVEFRANRKVLECVVRDNGVGRKKAIEHKAQRDSQHKSMALIVTQERLAMLNKETGSVPEDGNIIIRDLINDAGEISGTEVLIRIGME
jgi:sugar lactone lactonase YvrE